MLCLRKWTLDSKTLPGQVVRTQPGERGPVDFGEYALVESPIALTGADVVDLGALNCALVGYRRSRALAVGMGEKALDAAPDVRRAIFQAHTIPRPTGLKTLMPK